MDELAVGSVAGAFSGLTISPTVVDPSLASYAWVGGGDPRALPQSAPARLRDGARGAAVSSTFSVSSALTDVPSLCSAPVASSAERSGGGGGWRPSIGGQSIGKSKGKKFGLYFVSKAEGFCMGIVGTEKQRFCCGGGCFVHCSDQTFQFTISRLKKFTIVNFCIGHHTTVNNHCQF